MKINKKDANESMTDFSTLMPNNYYLAALGHLLALKVNKLTCRTQN